MRDTHIAFLLSACDRNAVPRDHSLWPGCIRQCGIIPINWGGNSDTMQSFGLALHALMVATLRIRMLFESKNPCLFPRGYGPQPSSTRGYPFPELTAVIPSCARTHLATILPVAASQVTFIELALDFEAFSGRNIPLSQRSRYQASLPLQERARVLRLAVSILRRHVASGA